ncbi:hypothetical protein QLH51_05640 [Sphingomonas sp. 2R-10]|uniref:hypothetical protein n=1 Tax=Sphingomonas sp. 2R-10 TaxID=3045148 RepID=UPI000F7822C7|nr:hypothetical protein [Sphingomonas sp. 2R-10]MDJ0276280.1 hypothetical protein [Sphingomonas sp. 2R-10]
MPDLLVIDVPPIFAGRRLPLRRYYPIIIETDDEWREWEAFIAGERDRPVAPDLLDRRPSRLICDDIGFIHYDPPVPGWPWILLCRWPPDHVALCATAAEDFARAAYTIEIFADAGSRADATAGLISALGSQQTVDVVHIPPSSDRGRS